MATVPIELLRAMRLHHWVKNVFVLAPLVFAHQVTDTDNVLRVLGAFVLFGLVASAVYLINDIADRAADRLHPDKCRRPIASGRLPLGVAATAAALMLVASIGGAALLSDRLALVLGAYLVLNLAYSFGLKRVVVLDVMILSSGFLLRAWAGAVVIDVVMSHWLVLCTGLISLFLGFVKRRQELVALDLEAPNQRPILKEYSIPFLDQMVSTVTAGTVVAYALYAFSPEVAEKLGTDWMGLTIPFVVFGIFRYLYLVYQRGHGQNPTALILRDVPLLINLALWAAACLLALYGGL
ncbi:MAG: decaprenyl-phosphate phosphoribosyltransferase [Acidobacteria bacterium]|nr:decaprenyl-phosphate phosphoribosyltransferase [Acidobacteriota bacterium]